MYVIIFTKKKLFWENHSSVGKLVFVLGATSSFAVAHPYTQIKLSAPPRLLGTTFDRIYMNGGGDDCRVRPEYPHTSHHIVRCIVRFYIAHPTEEFLSCLNCLAWTAFIKRLCDHSFSTVVKWYIATTMHSQFSMVCPKTGSVVRAACGSAWTQRW